MGPLIHAKKLGVVVGVGGLQEFIVSPSLLGTLNLVVVGPRGVGD